MWEYRLVEYTTEDGLRTYAVHDVFMEDGEPVDWQNAPLTYIGESVEEIRKDMLKVAAALTEPMLMSNQDDEDKNGRPLIRLAE